MFDVASHVRAVLLALQFEGGRTEQLQTLTDSEWRDLLLRWDFRRCMNPLDGNPRFITLIPVPK